LVLILCSLSLSLAHRFIGGLPDDKYGMLGLPGSNASMRGISLPSARWYHHRLDHFDPQNTKTWKQRYFVNFQYANRENDSPVFLLLGGEGEASPSWLVSGQMAANYGKHYNAILVLLEHRYYGRSHPTE